MSLNGVRPSSLDTSRDGLAEFWSLRDAGVLLTGLWRDRSGADACLASASLEEDRAVFVLADAITADHREFASHAPGARRLRMLYNQLAEGSVAQMRGPVRRLLGRAVTRGTAEVRAPTGQVLITIHFASRALSQGARPSRARRRRERRRDSPARRRVRTLTPGLRGGG